MMPYIENKLEQINLLKEYSGCDYLFCHSDLNGAKMHLNSAAHKNTDKIDVDEFVGYNKVMSGHIHLVQSNKNFTFVGSIHEMDRNDMNNQKGIFILDTNNDIEKFIPNNVSPKFKKIILNKEEDIELLTQDINKDWIDLVISSSLLVNNRKLRRKIENILQDGNFTSVEYIDDISVKVDEVKINENLSINLNYGEYIKNYIEVIKYDNDKIKKGVLDEFDEVINLYNESKRKL